MKMEVVDQEEEDGNRMIDCVGRATVKNVCIVGLDDDYPLAVTDRQEAFEEEIVAGIWCREMTEQTIPNVTLQLDSERGKALEVRIEGSRAGVEVDEAAIGRVQTLREAVSQGLRQPQILDRLQHQPQPQPSSVVRWEMFLPQHQLRVLLVEDDDSTHHVVSALLRNCSYEVISAENGLIAWELLMEPNNRVDLILTEVVMPYLSGIVLLERIMSHAVLKHIPVIMMSSHDSMGIVFKCLSKGAVDYLVKPVRKNELKNLWQHVWRRCHSCSGSGNGSGSGSRNQKVGQTNGVADGSNSSSNDEGNNTSRELNIGGGSDNGSGTQNSWIEKPAAVDSSHRPVDLDLVETKSVSIPHTAELHKNGHVFYAEQHGAKDSPDGAGAAFSTPRETVAELNSLHFKNGELGSGHRNLRKSTNFPNISQDGVQLEEMNRSAGRGISQGNSQVAIDINSDKGDDNSAEEQQADSEDTDYLLEQHASNSPSSKHKNLSDSSSPSMLELSLKRPRHFERNDGDEQGRGVLKHSHSSAFSRYNATAVQTPVLACPLDFCMPSGGPAGHVPEQGSCVGGSYPPSTPFALQTETVAFSNSSSKEAMTCFNSMLHVNSNQEGTMPHGFRASFIKEEGQLAPNSVMQMPPPGSFKESDFAGSTHRKAIVATGENVEVEEHGASYAHVSLPPNLKSQSHHHYRHYHHHHHIQHHYHHHHYQDQTFMNMQKEDQTVTNVGAGALRCGFSNVLKQSEENNGQSGSNTGYAGNGNGSLNGSTTGSNNPSNTLNNGSQAVVALPGRVNVDSDSRLQGGQGMTHSHGVIPDSDQRRTARREAALNKFRQKRKELCFEKKVRYQSRKKLAEQRPRVRGQFVKQSANKLTVTGDPQQVNKE